MKEKTIYECEYCGARFDSLEKIQDHEEQHKEQLKQQAEKKKLQQKQDEALEVIKQQISDYNKQYSQKLILRQGTSLEEAISRMFL